MRRVKTDDPDKLVYKEGGGGCASLFGAAALLPRACSLFSWRLLGRLHVRANGNCPPARRA